MKEILINVNMIVLSDNKNKGNLTTYKVLASVPLSS